MPSVAQASVTTNLPLDLMTGFMVYDRNNENPLFSSRSMAADRDFIETLQIELLSGANFQESKLNYSEAIVNEKFADMMGYAGSPVGQTFITRIDNAVSVKIIGVVKDFQISTLYQQESEVLKDVLPLIIFPREEAQADWWFPAGRVIARLHRADEATLEELNRKIKSLTRKDNACFTVYHSKIEQTYSDTLVYKRAVETSSLVLFFIVLSGLFGFIQDEISRRSKEVAIRKVYGATLKHILSLFLKDTVLISIPAILLGFVVSYITASGWLRQFSVRIVLDSLTFISVGAFILCGNIACIAALTWQTMIKKPACRPL
ncbi:MAG: FtsX-like permease family protein [Tannerella sp.]|jgi:putative ABC transport system permease protein|nr:FtsX-like permease family protein [Tannerella sp.]